MLKYSDCLLQWHFTSYRGCQTVTCPSSQADRCVVLIGNRKWIREKNFIEIPADVENKLQAQEQLGHTAILVAIDGEILELLSSDQDG